jgi:hypothetical protein
MATDLTDDTIAVAIIAVALVGISHLDVLSA